MSQLDIEHHKDRMKALISMQMEFPSNFIFFHIGRMNDEGYGWTPTSFVFRQSRDVTDKSPEGLEGKLGSASKSGLDVRYPGFVFPEEAAPWRESESMLFRDGSDGLYFKVTARRVRYSSIALSRYPTACLIFEEWPLKHEEVTQSLQLQKSRTMNDTERILAGIGIPAIDEMLQNMRTPLRIVKYESTRAMLGSVYGETDGRIMVYVHSVARVEHLNVFPSGSTGAIAAKVLPQDQRWCVG